MDRKLRLYLYIDDTGYRLERVEPENGHVVKCWNLVKKDGNHYHVHLDEFGMHCSCADFTFRHQHTEEKCKHCDALKELELL